MRPVLGPPGDTVFLEQGQARVRGPVPRARVRPVPPGAWALPAAPAAGRRRARPAPGGGGRSSRPGRRRPAPRGRCARPAGTTPAGPCTPAVWSRRPLPGVLEGRAAPRCRTAGTGKAPHRNPAGYPRRPLVFASGCHVLPGSREPVSENTGAGTERRGGALRGPAWTRSPRRAGRGGPRFRQRGSTAARAWKTGPGGACGEDDLPGGSHTPAPGNAEGQDWCPGLG